MADLPRSFWRLWIASGASALGDGAWAAALPLLASGLTRDPVALSFITIAIRLPWLLFGLLGGVLADRWNRWRVMWISDAIRGGLLAVATVGWIVDLIGIAELIAVTFLLGLGQVLFANASAAYLPELLDRDHQLLHRANARLTGTEWVGNGFLGLPVGAILFGLGQAIPFVVNALSFLFSSLLIRSLPATAPSADRTKRSLFADIRAGVACLVGDRLLLGLSLRPAFGNLAFSAGEAVFVLFAQEELHLSATGYGLVLAVEAVGAVTGTAMSRRLVRWLGSGGALTLASAVATCAQLVVGVSGSPVLVGAAMMASGAAVGAMFVVASSVRQAIVPGELMGRVAATSQLLALGAAPLGALLGGYLATTFNLRVPYLVGGGFLAVTTLISATMTRNRKIKDALAKAGSSTHD